MASDGAVTRAVGPSVSKIPGVLVGAAVAALLLGLGLPSLIAAVIATPGVEAMNQLRSGEMPPSDRLPRAAAALESSGRFWPDGALGSDRGYLLLKQAEAMASGPAREDAYGQAAEATRAALSSSPVQPSAWARLAYLELRRGDQTAALSALRMSLITGAVTPELMTSRLELGLRLSPLFDQEMTALMKRQVRLIWVLNPDYVTRLSADPAAGSLVHAALAELDEADMREFIRQNRR